MFASIQDARSKMASRDLVFRDALHEKLEDYIKEVSEEDFEKFLGEQSMTIEQRLEENKDVFKRLKNRKERFKKKPTDTSKLLLCRYLF